MIVGVVAFALMVMSAARFDPLGKAQGFFRMPEGPSRYDDDVDPLGRDRDDVLGHGRACWRACSSPLQLAFPQLNFEPYLNFGRVRPLHTSAVIFAFGGNALIATSFYVVQRTCRTQLAFPGLARFVFWGYQMFIVLAATGYLLGITQSQGICRARMVCRSVADHRLGRLCRGVHRHDACAATNRISMSPTGSTSPSS